MFRRIVFSVLPNIPNFVNDADFEHFTQRQPGTEYEPKTICAAQKSLTALGAKR
jgi:hypothetical protein